MENGTKLTKITSFKKPWDFLSNFYPSSVELGDETYPTVEHAYQAAKTLDSNERHLIYICGTAGKAKIQGRKLTLRPDWDSVKRDVMLDLLRQKFSDSNYLRWVLVGTDDAELIEGNWWHDHYWGVCMKPGCDLGGENWLGKLLMQVRTELKNEHVALS